MNTKESKEIFLILFIISVVYFSLKYFILGGEYIVYPITILVTFLHEFGHSFFAILTGGGVKNIQVNTDGSGFAVTYGGFRGIILMGGYIGSAIFGNLLLYIGAKKENISSKIIIFLSVIMFVIAIFFSNFTFLGIISSIILIILAIFFIFISLIIKQDSFNRIFLMFLGIASILYIIEDFNIGPSSDLEKFTDIFIFIPQFVWMIIWLIIVIIITGYNLKNIFSNKNNVKKNLI